ncbi:MAG: phosphonate C-P lyase system protein PhnG [Paracoccaceae bacterium]
MPELEARKNWMAVLAKADTAALMAAVDGLGPRPDFAWLRAPEIGTVMVRGRAGGTGAPFNLGEMTVARCTLRLEDGRVGLAYTPCRDRCHAETAAICDALLQGPEAMRIQAEVIAPLKAAAQAARNTQAARAEATKVDFFTMVRGESS